MKDYQWLPERRRVSTLWLNGVHCQVMRQRDFAEAIVYRMNKLDAESSGVFIVPAAPDDCPCDRPSESQRFWNCGTTERAVAIAKLYATADTTVRKTLRGHRKDLSKLDLGKLLAAD